MGVQVYRDLTVDFSNSRYIVINAKQHDSKSRFIRITCTNLWQETNFNPENFSAFIRCKKPDGCSVLNQCIISKKGYIIFELTEQMLAAIGTIYADLMIVDISKPNVNDNLIIFNENGEIVENNNSVISTMTFYINVLQKPFEDDEIISSNEFSALNDLLIKATKDYEHIIKETEKHMDNAAKSEENAKKSEENAKKSEENAKKSEENSAKSEKDAYKDAIASYNSALLSKSYAIGESGFLTNESWEKVITDSEDYISIESRANEDIENAKHYYEQSKSEADKAKTFADNAKTSKDAAKTFADSSRESSLLSRSYAVGDTDTREGETTDCAKYYYEQLKQISEDLNGALLPMGTIPFAQLVNQTKASGYMYNISDDFVSDATFKDGGNITYPAGTNVYYTADGFWDCLTASLLYGVKGNAETDFRKGFVNITPENIGVYSKTEMNTIIQTLQNTITALTDRVKTLEDIIESGDIIVNDKLVDSNGNNIVTNEEDIILLNVNLE